MNLMMMLIFIRMAFKMGERLEVPTQAPAIIVKILEKCWKQNSGDRIRFTEMACNQIQQEEQTKRENALHRWF